VSLTPLSLIEVSKAIMLGLSTDNPDGSYKTIEYAVYLYNDKIKDVRNSNTKYADFNHHYKAGDQIKIERKGTTISYYHLDGNGNTIRTLATQTGVSATSALHIDTSIKDKGVKLTGVRLVKGLSNLSKYAIDVHAPKPIANAWRVSSITSNNYSMAMPYMSGTMSGIMIGGAVSSGITPTFLFLSWNTRM
jgi:hypothetical protein